MKKLFLFFAALAFTGIIIQFRDAQTNDLIASVETEATGSTEADNVRYAIQKAFDAIFSQPRYY